MYYALYRFDGIKVFRSKNHSLLKRWVKWVNEGSNISLVKRIKKEELEALVGKENFQDPDGEGDRQCFGDFYTYPILVCDKGTFINNI